MVPSTLRRYHQATRSPAGAALLAVPLFLLYALGLLMASPSARSGADFISGRLLTLMPQDAYVASMVGIAVVVTLGVVYRLRRDTLRHLALGVPAIAEAALYGVAMAALIVAFLDEVELLGPILVPAGLVDRAVISAGAGFHEELVFRLALLPALVLLLHRGMQVHLAVATVAALALSSLLFASAHHLAGEPFEVYAFVYRTLAGAIFAGIFLARGFAVAAWSHAAYDFYVLGLAAS